MKNAMKKTLFTIIVGLLFSISAIAQWTAAETKLYEKSISLYNSQKYDKAIATILKVQEAHPFDEKLWNYRVTYEKGRYDAEYNRIIATLVKDINKGKKLSINSDNLSAYKVQMLSACMQATMYSEKQEQASSILRTWYVDPAVDTAISDDAKDNYNDGDKDYAAEDYTTAIKDYKKAIAKDSNYYNATFSIGYCYYKNAQYDEAIPWLKKAIRIEPGLVASYICEADCYIGSKKWEEAKNACIDGILIYPEYTFFDKLSTIADKMDKTFTRHWQERIANINDITLNQTPVTSGPFQYYCSAKDKISDYCGDEGIVKKPASFTSQKYLETFSWEFMLKKSTADDEKDYSEMEFARKMQTAGYLDCYCMVSCYHINFHAQYKDFAKNNADRIRTYINTILIK